MVSGVILTCVVAACLSVHVFLVARSKSSMNVASMPGGEGESSQVTPAVLQNVPFPSKLEIKGNMASNWKRCRQTGSERPGKSIHSYVASLCTLAKTCNYVSLLDSLICDRIVVGIRDNGTRKRLLKQAKLSLNKCIDICQ